MKLITTYRYAVYTSLIFTNIPWSANASLMVRRDRRSMHTSLCIFTSCQTNPLPRRGSGIQICRTSTIRASTSTNLFKDHGFVRTLELPTSPKSAAAFSQAIEGGAFQNGTIDAVVSPDIRSAFAFPFFNSSLGTMRDFQRSADENANPNKPTPDAIKSYWQVRTIAGQMRIPSYLQNQIVNAAKEIHSYGNGGSLLLVSGGHPLKKYWPINCHFPDSFDLLHTAHGFRNSGLIPSGVQLWAVENPLVNSVDRLEKKIRAGAEAFIVQPPLLPDRFTKWWDEANNRGLLDITEVIVGLPLITSSRNFSFWLRLTQATGKEAEVLLQDFRRADAGESISGKGAFFKTWNLKIIEMVKSLPKVSGMHLMPITSQGWRELAFLISKGKL